MSYVIHAALHARCLTCRTRRPLYGCRRVVSGSLSSSLVPPVPNIRTHSAYSLRGSWHYMSCDGYHTTGGPAHLPFQGSSMRAVQCKLGRYGSHLERQSSYLPHVPHAPLTDAPPLMPPTLLLTLFVLLYLHTAPHPAA